MMCDRDVVDELHQALELSQKYTRDEHSAFVTKYLHHLQSLSIDSTYKHTGCIRTVALCVSFVWYDTILTSLRFFSRCCHCFWSQSFYLHFPQPSPPLQLFKQLHLLTKMKITTVRCAVLKLLRVNGTFSKLLSVLLHGNNLLHFTQD